MARVRCVVRCHTADIDSYMVVPYDQFFDRLRCRIEKVHPIPVAASRASTGYADGSARQMISSRDYIRHRCRAIPLLGDGRVPLVSGYLGMILTILVLA